MIDFLNRNAGILTLIFSAIVAMSTVVYAFLTWQLTKETQRARKARTQPRIAIFLDSPTGAISIKNLIIQNVGEGSAYNIRFRVLEDFYIDKGQSVSGLNLVKDGLRYMAPGQRYDFYLVNILGKQELLSNDHLRIAVSYCDDEQEEIKEEFTIGFKHFFGLRHIGEQGISDLARHIEKMTRQLEWLTTDFNRIHVVVHSMKDVQEEYKSHRGPTLWTPSHTNTTSNES